MPIPTWPTSLPQKPLMAGFQRDTRRTSSSVADRRRPGEGAPPATAGVTNFEMPFRLTSAQLATFRTFYATDIQAGALTYTWTHPITGAAGVVPHRRAAGRSRRPALPGWSG